MYLEWKDPRCIVCLREAPLTKEHIIPRAIGGILTARFLCKPCNDMLGARYEAAAKEDPSIRIAIEEVCHLLPDALAEKLRNGQEFIAESSPGAVRGFLRSADFQVLSKMQEDGSIIQPTPLGRDSIEKHLREQGVAEDEIDRILKRFDSAPENTKIPIDEKMHVVKWSAGPLQPALDGRFLSDRVVVKIAYEFLACILGQSIATDHPPLSTARAILKDAAPVGEGVRVERLHADKYQALHGLFFEGNHPHVVIQVRLFGWLAFRVHFENLTIRAPSLTYTHLMDQGVDGWRIVDQKGST